MVTIIVVSFLMIMRKSVAREAALYLVSVTQERVRKCYEYALCGMLEKILVNVCLVKNKQNIVQVFWVIRRNRSIELLYRLIQI